MKKPTSLVKYTLVAVMIAGGALTGCRNSETSNIPEVQMAPAADVSDVEEPELGVKVPPATARIMGEVIEVIKPDAEGISATYCDSLPCRARIKVVSLIGLGDGFKGEMNMKDTVTVYFPTPALSTEEVVSDTPELQEYTTSGLHPGDLFQADLQVNPNAAEVENSPFVVTRLVRGGGE